jgi:hypothetical protein
MRRRYFAMQTGVLSVRLVVRTALASTAATVFKPVGNEETSGTRRRHLTNYRPGILLQNIDEMMGSNGCDANDVWVSLWLRATGPSAGDAATFVRSLCLTRNSSAIH